MPSDGGSADGADGARKDSSEVRGATSVGAGGSGYGHPRAPAGQNEERRGRGPRSRAGRRFRGRSTMSIRPTRPDARARGKKKRPVNWKRPLGEAGR